MRDSRHSIDVFSLPGFLQALHRHRRRVILAFAVMVMMTVVYMAQRVREYPSSATLFVRIGRETVSVDPTAEASGRLIGVTDTQEREIHSIVSLLSNRALLEQVVDQLGPQTILDYPEDGEPTGEFGLEEAVGSIRRFVQSTLSACGVLEHIPDREQAIEAVGDSLSIEAAESSSVITVTATAESPKLAQMIVSKVVDLHLTYHLQANSNPGSLTFFDAQTKRLRQELDRAANELAAMKNENSLASLESKKESLETRMLTLHENLTQATADLAASSSTVSALQQQLAGEAELIPSEETIGMAGSAKSAMREELYRLQILESELLAKLKESHPKIAEIRDQIEQARSVFEQEEQQVQTTTSTNAVHQQLRITLLVELANRAALQSRIETLQSERNKLKEEITRLNQGEVKLAALQRQVDLLDTNYRRYVENLEKVRIDKELESLQISNVNVVQDASYVESPVGPSNFVILMLGLMASAAGACGIAMFSESALPQDEPLRGAATRYDRPQLASVDHVSEPIEPAELLV